MWCWKCGAKLDEDSRFCTECGAAQYDQDEYDQNQHGQDEYDQNQHGQDEYDQNQHGQDEYDRGQYGQDEYDRGQYGQDEYDRGQYGQNEYDRGQYGQDEYDRGQYGQDEYDRGQYGQDKYDRGRYGQNEYGGDPYGQDDYDRDPYGRDPYGQDEYDRDPYGQDWEEPERKKFNKVWVIVPTVVLVCAALVVAGVFFVKNGGFGNGGKDEKGSLSAKTSDSQSAGKSSADSAETSALTEGATEKDAQQTEDPSFWENALDAINNTSISLSGTVQEDSAGVYSLTLDSAVNVCAYDENGDKTRLENITQVRLQQGSEVVSLADHNGDLIEATGAFKANSQMPELTVDGLVVTKAAVREEDIHKYTVKIEDCTWEEAYSRCRALGGYLVRINSLEEFNYITQSLDNVPETQGVQFYIGARRDAGSDSYYLVDENNALMGDRLDNGYTSWLNAIWLAGEPSYRDTTLGIEEAYVSMFRYGDENRWVINDVPNDLIAALSYNQGKIGYICEIPE